MIGGLWHGDGDDDTTGMSADCASHEDTAADSSVSSGGAGPEAVSSTFVAVLVGDADKAGGGGGSTVAIGRVVKKRSCDASGCELPTPITSPAFITRCPARSDDGGPPKCRLGRTGDEKSGGGSLNSAASIGADDRVLLKGDDGAAAGTGDDGAAAGAGDDGAAAWTGDDDRSVGGGALGWAASERPFEDVAAVERTFEDSAAFDDWAASFKEEIVLLRREVEDPRPFLELDTRVGVVVSVEAGAGVVRLRLLRLLRVGGGDGARRAGVGAGDDDEAAASSGIDCDFCGAGKTWERLGMGSHA